MAITTVLQNPGPVLPTEQHKALYYPLLDGVRALAVMLVVYAHWFSNCEVLGIQVGAIGVQLFFVLSGFLVTGILLDARNQNGETGRGQIIRNFWVRRALRIFPLYFATLAILVLLDVMPFRQTWPWHATYLSNVQFHLHGFQGEGLHFWTLSVEEQFYLLLPLLLLFLPKAQLVPVLLMAITCAPVWRWLNIAGRPDLLLPASLDGLCLGGLVAWVARNSTGRVQSKIMMIATLLGFAILIGCLWSGTGWWLKNTGLVLVFSGVIYWLTKAGSGVEKYILGASPIRAVGRVSYGIYVIHAFVPSVWGWMFFSSPIPLYRVVARLGVPEEWFTNVTASRIQWVGITAGLVILSWKYLETPFNRLKRHFPCCPASRERVVP